MSQLKVEVRSIPPMHELLEHPSFGSLQQHRTYTEAKQLLKNCVDQVRAQLLQDVWEGALPSTDPRQFIDELYQLVLQQASEQTPTTLYRVVNGTGTVLHTNFGRARLSEHVMDHVTHIATSYSNLEYDVDKGERGSRTQHVEKLLCSLTGAEAALVVNNNAASVYFVLNCFAKGKEVVVSRGELVEIGGSFRVSSIMEESGALLREVGTTNRTHVKDYAEVIREETAMLMKVHTSNFKTIGFTKSVSVDELVQCKRDTPHVLVYEDVGSGVLYDYRAHGIGDEPTVAEAVKAGCDLVSFSGDKLLGGVQAGFIVGKREYIDQLKRHQLARVLRVDKLTLAATEATLRLWASDENDQLHIPTHQMLLATQAELQKRVEAFADRLLHKAPQLGFNVTAEACTSRVGGGTMPDVELPSYALALAVSDVNSWVTALRKRALPVIGRVYQDRLLFDFRTISKDEEVLLLEALLEV
ncbi:L-seryl-tRNA(Sec) selenium transferase [Bacillus fonticola]|uniref:L-seryl-tRNA(Sec) selenium transferase n=1 Tax=Bacillus fonticola TaxID=2728853 RepID=UPI001D13EC23|nr:L-seryl-tRNA(Sec) selenium transferase [Bacillus fonticola]